MIVGFTGLKGSGKDTAGAYLVKEYGFKRLSFADKLKQSAASCFGIDPQIWDNLKNDPNAAVGIFTDTNHYEECWETIKMISVREFLQNYGTEAHRDIFGFDFWVDAAFEGIDTDENWVVTDVRFNNEAAAIWEKDGGVYRIDRGDVSADTHASEKGVSDTLLDGTIANTGSKEKLYILLDVLMDRLGVPALA